MVEYGGAQAEWHEQAERLKHTFGKAGPTDIKYKDNDAIPMRYPEQQSR